MTVWMVSKNRGGRHSCEKPCPTVMALGMGDDTQSSWSLEDDGVESKARTDNGKPPYSGVRAMVLGIGMLDLDGIWL